MAATVHHLFIGIVMGRRCGWLAMSELQASHAIALHLHRRERKHERAE
jgi:6-phosphofructokinase